MERWINMLEVNCDPEREAEYCEWNAKVHCPDVLKTPGFKRARLYVNREMRDGRGKYLNIYEIETLDITKTMQIRLEQSAHETAQGRDLADRPHLVFPIWRDVLFKEFFQQTTTINENKAVASKGKWLNMVEQNFDPTREKEYHDWYNNIHIPDILRTPDFMSAYRYKSSSFRDGRGMFLANYEIATDDIAQTMKLRLSQRDEEVKAGRASVSRNNLTRPVWRDVLWNLVDDQKAST